MASCEKPAGKKLQPWHGCLQSTWQSRRIRPTRIRSTERTLTLLRPAIRKELSKYKTWAETGLGKCIYTRLHQGPQPSTLSRPERFKQEDTAPTTQRNAPVCFITCRTLLACYGTAPSNSRALGQFNAFFRERAACNSGIPEHSLGCTVCAKPDPQGGLHVQLTNPAVASPL